MLIIALSTFSFKSLLNIDSIRSMKNLPPSKAGIGSKLITAKDMDRSAMIPKNIIIPKVLK